MDQTLPFGDIIVLGAVALFIILRYRSILGQNRGRDMRQERVRKVVSFAENQPSFAEKEQSTKEEEVETLTLPAASAQSVQALARIKGLDPDFTTESFLNGARAAYDMVIDAINTQDKETLRALLSKDVYESVEKELDRLKADGKTRHTTLVALKSADITDIQFKRSVAQVVVRFMSEQITVVRDRDEKIVEGDVSHVEEVMDEWVMERDVKSRNPNWTIIAT